MSSLKGSIDLGTNTCLMLLAEVNEASRRVEKVVSDHATIVRLGQEVDRTRRLHPDAVDRTLKCLREYASIARAAGVDPGVVIAVATATARDAQNGAEFFSRVEAETGFRFRTLTGDEEARFTFEGGLLPGMSVESSAVIDIGGGSTELMSARGGRSIDMGSVRFTERYLKSDPVTDSEFWSCQDEVDALLEQMMAWRAGLSRDAQLVAVAGTATTLGQWFLEMPHFNASAVDACTLTRGDVHRQVEELKWRTVDERKRLTGIEAKRADVLLAGALILWRVMEKLDFSSARISTRGLRYGVMAL